MADAVTFAGIEEEHLIGFGHGLVLTDVADVGAAVGKDERSDARVLFSAAVAVSAAAVDVAYDVGGGIKEEFGGDFRAQGGLRAVNAMRERVTGKCMNLRHVG